jgi:hypothetical protein
MSAESIFSELTTRQWDCIREWIANREPESLYFDFKQKRDATKYTLEDGDRQNIAKALSGFANGGGGVLVMGLGRTAGRHGDDPDLVGTVCRIAQVERFCERLDREAAQLTDPPISGLNFLPIHDPDAGDGSGVAAVLVPASDALPHRTLRGTNDYYIRIGTRTLAMSHPMLAEKFGRRPLPKLQLIAKFHGEGPNCVIRFGLRNNGRGAARQPAVHFNHIDNAFKWFEAQLNPGWESPRTFGPSVGIWYCSNANGVVYPSADATFGMVRKRMEGPTPTQVELTGRLHALDAPPVAFSASVSIEREVCLPKGLLVQDR